MRLNNDSYNYYRLMGRRFQYYASFTNHTEYMVRARAREHSNTINIKFYASARTHPLNSCP